jgi:hypothetical protein
MTQDLQHLSFRTHRGLQVVRKKTVVLLVVGGAHRVLTIGLVQLMPQLLIASSLTQLPWRPMLDIEKFKCMTSRYSVLDLLLLFLNTGENLQETPLPSCFSRRSIFIS